MGLRPDVFDSNAKRVGSEAQPTKIRVLMKSFVSHLEAAIDGTRLDPDTQHTLHKDRPIWVRYDLDAVRRSISRESFANRPRSMWRYRELLPLSVDLEPVSLGEGMSPLL